MYSRAMSNMSHMVNLMAQLDSYKLLPMVRKLVVPFCDEHFDDVQHYLTAPIDEVSDSIKGNVIVSMMLMGFTVVRVRSILAPSIACFICDLEVKGDTSHA